MIPLTDTIYIDQIIPPPQKEERAATVSRLPIRRPPTLPDLNLPILPSAHPHKPQESQPNPPTIPPPQQILPNLSVPKIRNPKPRIKFFILIR